eukprot:4682428-Pyramimonas_sp.AAC.1
MSRRRARRVDRRTEEAGASERSPTIDFDQMPDRKRFSCEGHEASTPEKPTLQELPPACRRAAKPLQLAPLTSRPGRSFARRPTLGPRA